MNIQEYIKSGVIESYVLGVADENDIAELQRLKLLHPEIAMAVEDGERWLEEYALTHAVPAGDVGMRVLYALNEGPRTPAPVMVSRRGLLPGFYRYVMAASLFLVMASAGLAYYFYQQYRTEAANYAILSDPELIKVSLGGVAGKEINSATVYWNPKTTEAWLQPDHLPAAPAGKQFQVWALVDGKPIDAGLLESSTGLRRLKPIEKAQAFAITLEKTGGSPTPTLSRMYVMGKVKS